MTTSANTQPTHQQDAILMQLAHIPTGQVSTYGALAKAAGLPGYARFVGQVLRRLPKDTTLPWHRVINAQGKLSFPEHSPPFIEQKKRLLKEGVELMNNKISLKKYQIHG
jgi:methylated-DNA-protein-cysteine methyltransferase-like protein